MQGAPYIVTDETVRNQFLVRLVNKQDDSQTFVLELPDAPDALQRSGFVDAVQLGALGEQVVPLILQVSRADYTGRFHLTVLVSDAAGNYTLKREIEFVGPDPELLKDDRP
jgi:hypothetical protein